MPPELCRASRYDERSPLPVHHSTTGISSDAAGVFQVCVTWRHRAPTEGGRRVARRSLSRRVVSRRATFTRLPGHDRPVPAKQGANFLQRHLTRVAPGLRRKGRSRPGNLAGCHAGSLHAERGVRQPIA